jgi:hypothetical protein
MDIFSEHESGSPGVSAVFGVCEHVPDVNLFPVVTDGHDQPELIAPDVKDGKSSHLIRGGEGHPQISEGRIVGLPNDGKPDVEWGSCVRMCPRKLHQPFSRNDVHTANGISY